MKNFFFLFLILTISNKSFSQETDGLLDIYKYDKEKYSEKVLTRAKKLKCFEKKRKYFLYFIFHVSTSKEMTKETFTEQNLLQKSRFIFNKESNDFPSNECIVYRDSLRVKLLSSDLRITCTFDYPFHELLLRHFAKNNLDFAFRISGSSGSVYFAIDDNRNVQVLIIKNGELTARSLEDFKKCCWDELYL